MGTYTKKQFLEDVAKEAKALKEHATNRELSNLDFESFDPGNPNECIYGQMTGICTSPRAHELIANCCIRLVDNEKYDDSDGFETIAESINGEVESVEQLNEKRDKSGCALLYVSTLEAYIMYEGADNENLIAYLKGERKDLVL